MAAAAAEAAAGSKAAAASAASSEAADMSMSASDGSAGRTCVEAAANGRPQVSGEAALQREDGSGSGVPMGGNDGNGDGVAACAGGGAPVE